MVCICLDNMQISAVLLMLCNYLDSLQLTLLFATVLRVCNCPNEPWFRLFWHLFMLFVDPGKAMDCSSKTGVNNHLIG